MPSVGASSGDFFEATIKTGRWPQATPEDWAALEAHHEGCSAALRGASDISRLAYRRQFADSLVGQAGDALLAAHDENVDLWDKHANGHARRASIAYVNSTAILELQIGLTSLIDEGRPVFIEAVRERDLVRAQEVLTKYTTQANDLVTEAVYQITGKRPQPGNGATQALDDSDNKGDGENRTNQGQGGHHSKQSEVDSNQPGQGARSDRDIHSGHGDDPSATDPVKRQTEVLPPGSPDAPGDPVGKQTGVDRLPFSFNEPQQVPTPVAVSEPRPGGFGDRGLGAGGVWGGGLRGLDSVARSAISPQSSFPTSAASAVTPPSSTPTPSNPIWQAPSGYQSGLASGMGSSGAMPTSAFQQATQPYAQQAIPMTAEAASVPGMGTPAAASPGAAAFGQPGPPMATGGGPAGGGPVPVMPTPAMAGGAALSPAPYNAPGGGLVQSVPSAPPAPGGSSSPTAAPPPGGGPAAGAAPVFAGSTGALGGAAASSTDVANPDLVAAQNLLAALVKSCPPADPIFWAVSVLRTPIGAQTVIASSVGGGAYLPAGVRLPSSVRLATLDPALPVRWAQRWMGWQAPSAILVDHFEQLQAAVNGVKVSAIATSELYPRRPQCGGDFAAMRHQELLMSGLAPLTGAHRLAVSDPALWVQLGAIPVAMQGQLAGWITEKTIEQDEQQRAERAAAGQYSVDDYREGLRPDMAMVRALRSGSFSREDWDRLEMAAMFADGEATLRAPRDDDESETTKQARYWYRIKYQEARLMEMVLCWRDWLLATNASPERPMPTLPDIAYCAQQFGHASLVATLVSQVLGGLPQQEETTQT